MSKERVGLNASQISDNWNQKMKGAVGRMQAGVDAVTVSPMEKAATRKDAYLQGITRAANDGTWEAGLRAVPLQDWKNVTKNKISSSLAAGVDAAMNKRRRFDNYLVNTLNAILPEISAMPKYTLEDSVNRCRRLFEHMQQNRYRTA